MENFNKHIDLLDRYYRGETSADEEMALLYAIENGEIPEEELDRYYKSKWNASGDEMDPALQDELYRKVKAEIEAGRSRKLRRIFTKALAYAACIAIGVVFTWSALHQQPQEENLSKLYSVITEKGQKTTVILPDGTTVWLNSDSRLSYDMSYDINDRNVKLEGEGYFEVAEDQERPFTVHLANYSVTALGTSFNISAYSNENHITTTLIEGKVRVHSNAIDTQLTENQAITYDKTSNKFMKENDVQSYISGLWRNNELAVSPGTTLMELTVILERNYNIQFEFQDESIKKYKFEGIIKNSQLTNILELISLSAPVKYSIRGNKVILDRK